MKKLAIIAAATLSAAAFSSPAFACKSGCTPPPPPPPTSENCNVCSHDIVVKGPQIQVTALKGSFSVAAAKDEAYANNNMSSNTAGVLIDKGVASVQITALKDTGVLAMASEKAFAQNNLASNIGSVGVGADQLQVVAAKGSYMGAYAKDNSTAVQNFSTNNACQNCNPNTPK